MSIFRVFSVSHMGVQFCSFVWDDRIAAGELRDYECIKRAHFSNYNEYFSDASCRFHLFCNRDDGIVAITCSKQNTSDTERPKYSTDFFFCFSRIERKQNRKGSLTPKKCVQKMAWEGFFVITIDVLRQNIGKRANLGQNIAEERLKSKF